MEKITCVSCGVEVKTKEQWLKEHCLAVKDKKTGHGLTPKQSGRLQ